jgi:hypothetical protein
VIGERFHEVGGGSAHRFSTVALFLTTVLVTPTLVQGRSMAKSFSGEAPTPNETQKPLQADLVDVLAITPADLRSLQGRFKDGPGDPVEDVRRARELMGTEDR